MVQFNSCSDNIKFTYDFFKKSSCSLDVKVVSSNSKLLINLYGKPIDCFEKSH